MLLFSFIKYVNLSLFKDSSFKNFNSSSQFSLDKLKDSSVLNHLIN